MPSKNIQEQPLKGGEGQKRTVMQMSKLSETHSEQKRGRGRPAGSKNKPSQLIPKELAAEFLGVVKEILPEEYYKEMRDAIRKGKNISTLNEAKIMLKLMGPPIWKRLIEEANSKPQLPPGFDPDLEDELGDIPQQSSAFAKDLDERIKVWMNMAALVERLEKSDEAAHSGTEPILEVFAKRGIDAGRIEFITNTVARNLGGNSDGDRRGTIEVRAIPAQVAERPLDVQDWEQGETVRDVSDDFSGSLPFGGDEA